MKHEPADLPLITLENVSARIGKKTVISNLSWKLLENRSWAILGPNGSGKTSLLRIIMGELSTCSGTVKFRPGFPEGSISAVTHEQHRALMEKEGKKNIFEFQGEYSSKFTTAGKVILGNFRGKDSIAEVEKLAEELQIGYLLDRGVKYLSTGEMRKVLIAAALMESPSVLILDEPFEGLDVKARIQLLDIIDKLIEKKITIILVTHRRDLIPQGISHILCLKECRLFSHGKKQDILVSPLLNDLYDHRPEALPDLPVMEKPSGNRFFNETNRFFNETNRFFNETNRFFNETNRTFKGTNTPLNGTNSFFKESDTLISMKDVSVEYNSFPTLSNINWIMKKGENWAITGPNGAGKSTLLSLISGDNPKAYGKEIFLFGRKRGTGETIWEIKEKVGIISSEFQVGYVGDITAFEVVLSGFFDSVGLYDRASITQREIAEAWIKKLSLEENSQRNFGDLSFGEQRCYLLCRAMVKMPLLLILDEPCQGLDQPGRKLFLSLLDQIGKKTPTHILYVTHHEEDSLSCIDNHLKLEPFPGGGYTARAAGL